MAGCVVVWTNQRAISLRDAIVLVPFAQLLPEARRAFARTGGWMPRIETTKTLAACLGPAATPQPGQISFDATLDALSAAALLRSQGWGAAWARRDPRGFDQASTALVAAAHELVRASAVLPPAERPAHWDRARELLTPMAGPGTTERLLARVALEWASLAPPLPTDRLFGLTPAAWIAVQAGGADALTGRLIADADAPSLVLVADSPGDDAFGNVAMTCLPAFTVCDGFEHEAQCAAAQVLAHVQRGEVPVALIAQDRVLVRRVRALLERHRLRLLDETGWKLSTTRAAARVMGLLQAARPDATTDALLDWLKTGSTVDDTALGALEAACRRDPVTRIGGLARATLEPAAARLASAASEVLSRLAATRRQPLAAWLAALAAALEACSSLEALRADDAGRQVLAALRLEPKVSLTGAWAAGAAQVAMDLHQFTTWVDGVLEQATFRPAAAFDDAAEVIVTPLAGAMLRPFAAAVLPGADDKHLGAQATTVSLLNDAQAAALGVPTAADRRKAELLAFVQLLAVPHVTLLRRRADGTDPLADSPLVERLSIALAARGRAMTAWPDPRTEIAVASTPIRMTAPVAPTLLPARLSASACEALRACPYRFFALNMLRLREDDELEREVEKRDYGTWLHAVLFNFHRTRAAPGGPAVEVARLMALARVSQEAQGITDADFLPFATSFESFAPRYISWLHARDVHGVRWSSGEDEVGLQLEALGGTELRGIIDRIDERRNDGRAAIELIDYKTGSAASLREKVRQPLEDTQLAFYAALVRSRSALPLTACYLALDGSKGPEEVEHQGVEDSAAALVEGLADDLRRLRAGAGLPALGVGSTCEYCTARGICRRDHWAGDNA